MEQKALIESNNPLSPEILKTPDQVALEKHGRALAKADKLIASAELDANGKKKLTGITSATAQYALDTMSWDRSHKDQQTQEYPLASVPDNVIEAQRLIYNAYRPSERIQQFQQQGYEKACSGIPDEELVPIMDTWGTMDIERKQSVLSTFANKLSSSFGFEKPVPLIFMEQDMSDAEATYVEGKGVAIPKSYLTKHKNMSVALEMIAHEINHAVQEKLLKDKDTKNIPDVEWFRLSEERQAFIPMQEFKQRGKMAESPDSTYHSLPIEQDSFNAQKIFRTELEKRISPVMDKKLESLGLPPYSEVKTILAIHSVLDEFIDIGIPVTQDSLAKRLTSEDIKYLEKNKGVSTYEQYHGSISVTRKKIVENFKGILD